MYKFVKYGPLIDLASRRHGSYLTKYLGLVFNTKLYSVLLDIWLVDHALKWLLNRSHFVLVVCVIVQCKLYAKNVFIKSPWVQTVHRRRCLPEDLTKLIFVIKYNCGRGPDFSVNHLSGVAVFVLVFPEFNYGAAQFVILFYTVKRGRDDMYLFFCSSQTMPYLKSWVRRDKGEYWKALRHKSTIYSVMKLNILVE